MDTTLVAFVLVVAVMAFVLFLLPRMRRERPTREQRRARYIVFVTQLVFVAVLLTLTNQGWDLGGWRLYLLAVVFTAATFGAMWLVRRLDG